jgi:quinol monooxygenase YgiN
MIPMPTQDRTVTIHPYFRVADGKMDEFRAFCEKLVSMAAAEPDCLYYGFSFHENQVFCREGYTGAAALLAHLANVGAVLQEALQISEITRLEVHGVEEELAKLQEPLAAFGPTYYALEYGVRK